MRLPGRVGATAHALKQIFDEIDAELQVACDVLEQLGWPPGRLSISNGPLSSLEFLRPGWDPGYPRSTAPVLTRQTPLSGGVQEIIILAGEENPTDLHVFRAIHEFGGPIMRAWFGWLVCPELLPKPNEKTLAKADPERHAWERNTHGGYAGEDRRPAKSPGWTEYRRSWGDGAIVVEEERAIDGERGAWWRK